MGTASTLSSTLFGRTRGAVLAVLFGHVGESYYLRQLARMTGITLGPVQRELRQLVDAGLVTRKTLGTQTLFSVNEASPIFAEMRAISRRRRNPCISPLRSPSGSEDRPCFCLWLRGGFREGQQSDVDLMIVGGVHFADVVDRIAHAQKTLSREINPTVYTANEFRGKLRGTS